MGYTHTPACAHMQRQKSRWLWFLSVKPCRCGPLLLRWLLAQPIIGIHFPLLIPPQYFFFPFSLDRGPWVKRRGECSITTRSDPIKYRFNQPRSRRVNTQSDQARGNWRPSSVGAGFYPRAEGLGFVGEDTLIPSDLSIEHVHVSAGLVLTFKGIVWIVWSGVVLLIVNLLTTADCGWHARSNEVQRTRSAARGVKLTWKGSPKKYENSEVVFTIFRVFSSLHFCCQTAFSDRKRQLNLQNVAPSKPTKLHRQN